MNCDYYIASHCRLKHEDGVECKGDCNACPYSTSRNATDKSPTLRKVWDLYNEYATANSRMTAHSLYGKNRIINSFCRHMEINADALRISELYDGEMLTEFRNRMEGEMQPCTIAKMIDTVRGLCQPLPRKYYKAKHGIFIQGIDPVECKAPCAPFTDYNEESWQKVIEFQADLYNKKEWDFFILSVLQLDCGLRHVDAFRVEPSNIVTDGKQTKIILKSHKNGIETTNPIHPVKLPLFLHAIEEWRKTKRHRLRSDVVTLMRFAPEGKVRPDFEDEVGMDCQRRFNKRIEEFFGEMRTGHKKGHWLRKMGASRIYADKRDMSAVLAYLGDKSRRIAEDHYAKRLGLPQGFQGLT